MGDVEASKITYWGARHSLATLPEIWSGQYRFWSLVDMKWATGDLVVLE